MNKEIFDLLKKYHILTDTPTTGPDLEVVTKAVLMRVSKLNLSLNQVERAFEFGLKEDMERVSKSDNNYYKVNGARFLSWLNKYYDSIFRSNRSTESTADVSPEIKEKIAKEGIATCIEFYKNRGVVLDAGSALYSYLERKGDIPKDAWNAYVLEAEQREYDRLNGERMNCMDRGRRVEIDRELSDLIEGSKTVESQAKLLALKVYIDQIITNETL